MVGVPLRRACIKCSSRRVKCDETRPKCRTCARLGIDCPGYNDGVFKWQDQTKRVREKYRSDGSAKSDVLSVRGAGHDGIGGRNGQIQPTSTLTSSITSPLQQLYEIVILHPFANSHINLSSGRLVRELDLQTLINFRPRAFESYISFIPHRLGYNQALDDATDCLLTIYKEILISKSQSFSDVGQRKYARAVHSLRLNLADDRKMLEAETLCATLLMGLVEVLANYESASMLTHVHGASELIRLRGPNMHTEPFERAMMLAAQGPLSTESISKGSTNSLDSAIWRNFIATVPDHSQLDEDRPCSKLKFVDGASIPQLVQDMLSILKEQRSDPIYISAFLEKALRFRQKFLTWASEVHNYIHQGSINNAWSPLQQMLLSRIDIPDFSQALSCSIATCPPLDIGSYGNCYGWMILINRTIMAMGENQYSNCDDAGNDSHPLFDNLEEENVRLAQQAFETETYLRVNRPIGLLYYNFSLNVARATLATTKEWSSTKSYSPDGLISLSTAEQFLQLIRDFAGF